MRLGVISLLTGLLVSTTVGAAEPGDWYLGVGAGKSRLDPDTSASSYSLADTTADGGKVFGGYYLSKRIALEGEYADLGEVTLSPTGHIDYRSYGVSGLYYLLREDTPGFSGWGVAARVGLSKLENSSDIPIRQQHNFTLHFGLSATVQVTRSWKLSIESVTYDEDAAMNSVSLIYQFGGRTSDEPKRQSASTSILTAGPADTDGDGIVNDRDNCPGTPPGSSVDALGCPRVLDDDGDGIANDLDRCPQTSPAISVDENGCDADTDRDGIVGDADLCPGSPQGIVIDRDGCAPFQALIRQLRFKPGSATLDPAGRRVLDKVAEQLDLFPHVKLEIQAHTDSQGDEKINQRLSQQRAEAVLVYLLNRRVDLSRLKATGFGSSRPVADNDTPEGRARNRRVELHERLN